MQMILSPFTWTCIRADHYPAPAKNMPREVQLTGNLPELS